MVGQTISHYRVLRTVGGGGMGEVCEAEDLRLGRHVALKFLSPARPITPEALQRFEREARAASALNHPNICTIHEFGEQEGQRFIAMELLHGSTLRDRLKHDPCPLDQCLDLAIEVADALEAAHRAGIIHRDITPSNIFVTDEGHAKVLDFGLAKLAFEKAPVAVTSDGTTKAADPATLTSPGAVMGTVAYMSPEQIQGEELDSRTDLFSFGCVLYEMATGTRPFGGKTPALVFDAILHETPRGSARIPPALQQILDKALEKDRKLRYQNAGEIKRDLQRLRRDSSVPPRRAASAARGRGWIVGGVVLIAVTAVGAIAYLTARAARDAVPTGVARQITSMPGLETDPAISPDGSTIAFAAREGNGNADIWMVDVHGGPPTRATTDPASDRYPAWFPDGGTFAFVSDRNGRASIWRAPRLDGDAATLLIPDADNPAMSPDGSEIAFVRPHGGHTRIAIARIDNPGDVRFLTTDRDGKWDHSRPAWSPDGQTICYDAWDGLWLVPAHGGGAARRLTTADAHNDSEPTWSANGRFVYFTGLRDRHTALWRIARDGGTAERVTVGSGTERTPRVSGDGRLIAFSTSIGTRDLVIHDLSTAQEIQFGSSREEIFPVFAPDARQVYFVSDRWGSQDIWSQEISDGKPVGAARRVAEMDGVESHLACSPDGQWIAYYRILNGRRDIFIISSRGGTAHRVTDDPSGSVDPAWSPDGTQLAFASERDGTSQIWKQQVSAGIPIGPSTRVTSEPGLHGAPTWSPDGSKIAYIIATEPARSMVGIIAADGSRRATLVSSGGNILSVRWNAANRMLLAIGRWGSTQFELRAIDPDDSTVQFAASSVEIGGDSASVVLDTSRDGRFIVFPRGVLEGDIWLLDAGSRRF